MPKQSQKFAVMKFEILHMKDVVDFWWQIDCQFCPEQQA